MEPFLRPPRSVRILAAIAVLGLAWHLAHTIFGLGGRGEHRFYDVHLFIAVMALAAIICLARAVRVREGRGAWLVAGMGIASSTVGDLIFNFAWPDVAAVPYPSIADVFYLGFYPATYIALVLLARRLVGKPGPGVWLDGVIVGLTLSAVVAAVIFPAVVEATTGTAATVATTLAYPVGDLVLLFVVAAVFTMAGFRPGRPLALIGVGLLLWAVADCVYASLASNDAYREGTLLDSMWPAGVLLVACAAWQPVAATRLRRAETLPVFAVSAAFMLLALGLVILDHYIRLTPLALWLASAAVGLGVVRTAITFVGKLRALQDAETEALTDGLTGIGNRRLLMLDLERALELGKAAPPATLAFFDLDGFKHYNDLFGHAAGDALLARLGRRLAASVEGHGRAYRLGGDEFCLLIDREIGDGDSLLEEAAVALSEVGNGFDVRNSTGHVTMPAEAASPEQTVQIADERMYAEKGIGRRSAEHQSRDVLLQILHEQEPDLHEHLTDVAALSGAVARRLGLDPEAVDEVRRAAQLHDIGKIAIPAAILHKPGPLDAEEWAFMRQHTIIGERILAAAPALRPVARLVRLSHERYDGDGYPDHLAGDEIPLGARIIAVCDAYHAMVSDRSYREAMTQSDTLAELHRCAGSQFDPGVLDALTAALESEAETACAAGTTAVPG
jgi:two-component system cell cycle response regulator